MVSFLVDFERLRWIREFRTVRRKDIFAKMMAIPPLKVVAFPRQNSRMYLVFSKVEVSKR